MSLPHHRFTAKIVCSNLFIFILLCFIYHFLVFFFFCFPYSFFHTFYSTFNRYQQNHDLPGNKDVLTAILIFFLLESDFYKNDPIFWRRRDLPNIQAHNERICFQLTAKRRRAHTHTYQDGRQHTDTHRHTTTSAGRGSHCTTKNIPHHTKITLVYVVKRYETPKLRVTFSKGTFFAMATS